MKLEEIEQRNRKEMVKYHNRLLVVNIENLIPTQKKVRKDTLAYYTFFFKKFGSLHNIDTRPPEIITINDKKYLREGHHRAVWYLLNGISQMAALVTQSEENTDFENRLCTADGVAAQRVGINSVKDFLKTIDDPNRYKATQLEATL